MLPNNPGQNDNDPDGNGAGFFVKQTNLLKLRRDVDQIAAEASVSGLRFVLTEARIKRLHAICMTGLLPDAGEYRASEVGLTNRPHIFPTWAEVPILMKAFCDFVNAEWDKRDLVWMSAFCLWRLNWIHPFRNGNGRTARELSYLVLSLKFGGIIPKNNSVIEQIMSQKILFEQVLMGCDQAFSTTHNFDASVAGMAAFLSDLFKKQLMENL